MNEEKIIQEILTLKDDVRDIRATMITKADYEKHTALLENIVTIVKKTQEDHVFTIELYKRLRAELDEQKEEIRKIKMQLKMA